MKPRRSAQAGVMALVLALALPVLLGLAALVLDLGRLVVLKSEVQNAVDACALAASTALTGVDDPTIFDVGRAHALALTDPSAQGEAARPAASINRLHFQAETFRPEQMEVSYGSNPDGPFVAATATQTQGLAPAQARYAQCRYVDRDRPLWLWPALAALGLSAAQTATVPAAAVATLAPGQSVCVMPLGLCAVPGQTAGTRWGLTVGARYTAVNDPSSGYGSGNFGWVDFTPPAGGASELSGLIEGTGVCGVRMGQQVGQPGQAQSITKAWNTRFGVYGAGATPAKASPDYTGWGYDSGGNHLADYLQRRATRTAFQGQLTGGISGLTAAQHRQWGQQRRTVAAPIVACDGWNGGKGSALLPVLDLGCVLLLAPVRAGSGPKGAGVAAAMDIEFLGRLGEPGTPCATLGVAGGGGGAMVPALVQ